VDVHAGIQADHVVAGPEKPDPRPLGRPAVGMREGVGLVGFIGTHYRHAQLGEAWPQPCGGVEDLRVALLANQPPHQSHHDVAGGGRAELLAGRGPVIDRDSARVEPLEVDAVADHGEAVGGHPQAAERGQVLRAHEQLRLGAGGGQPLEAVDDCPLGPVVLGQGVQAVDRVHDDRHTGHPAGQPTVDAGFRGVRVDDRRPDAPEQCHQLGQRPGVLERRHGPGGMGEREMADAPTVQRLDVRTRRRGTDHVVPRPADALELGAQQQFQAHVDGGHVDHRRRSGAHVVAVA